MWPGVRIENPNFQLWEISKKVGQLWADLSDSEKSIYHDEFESEKVLLLSAPYYIIPFNKVEFEKQMRNYQQSHGQYLSVKTKSVKNLIDKGLSYGGGTSRKGGSSDQNSLSGIVIQPVDDEDPCEMTQQKLSAIRYGLNKLNYIYIYNMDKLKIETID